MIAPSSCWLANCLKAMTVDMGELPLSPPQTDYLAGQVTIDSPVALGTYLSLLERVGTYCDEEEIGLRLSEHLTSRDFGIYGYIMLNTTTLRDYLSLIERYHMALGDYSVTRFIPQEHSGYSEYEVVLPSELSPKHDIALTLALRVNMVRSRLGNDSWRPLSAGFSFAEPANLDRYQQIFGENLHFNQISNFIEVDNGCLDTVINGSDPQLLQIFMDQAEELLDQSNEPSDIIHRTKVQLMNRIGTEESSQEHIAHAFNLSRATYQRRLEEQGTSFRQLKNEVIYQLATKALSESRARVSDIALKMGYSDLSAFDRAFCKLSGGVTPLGYRQRFQ